MPRGGAKRVVVVARCAHLGLGGSKIIAFFCCTRNRNDTYLPKSAKSEQLNMSSATRIRDQRRTNPAGFTLLELIAIVAISGF